MNNPKERLLKQVLTYSDGNLTIFETPKLVNSREQVFKYEKLSKNSIYQNLWKFRYSLVHAARTCQSTITSLLDQTHMIQAMRGRDNFCFALIDTNIG